MMKTLILITCFFFTFLAKAEMSKTTMISLNTIYLDRDYDNNGIKSQSKETDTDIRLMRIEKGWSYGGIYSMSSNDSSDSGRTSYGLSGGYFSEKDFYVVAHYFLSSKYNTGGGSEYTKGSGYGIDLGFVSKITSSFFAGIVLTHRSYSYAEQSGGGAGTTTVNATHKELIPLFTFAVSLQ